MTDLEGLGVGRAEKVCGYATQTIKAGVDIALFKQMGEGRQGL